ncbi:HAD family hydrolase [Streptomyces sp. NPDC005483]|uniref:HAD family hydrolase n=1 Tax=Streptomyces sp. NPDC005483 TaxID=3154882 RepID=UPI0033B27F74
MRNELAESADCADFEHLLATFQGKGSAGHLWRAYLDHMAAAVHCRPAVLDSLTRLKEAGWSIGVATDGASDIRHAKARATGLNELIDGIAACGDIDVRSQDVRLFELAAARYGTQSTPGGWMTGTTRSPTSPAVRRQVAHDPGARACPARGFRDSAPPG